MVRSKFSFKTYCFLLLLIFLFLGCHSQKVITTKQYQSKDKYEKQQYKNANEALANNDFEVAKKFQMSNSSKQLIKGIELLQNQEPTKAETIFKTIPKTDSAYYKYATSLMLRYYFSHTMWESFLRLIESTESTTPDTEAVKDYYNFPKEEITFPLNDSVFIPIKKLDYAKTPVVEVSINGNKKRFIVDTGCTISAVSSETANECKITTGNNSLHIIDANNIINEKVTFAGSIQNLQISNLNIANHPVIISNNLKFKILGITVHKVDGIIGWNLLQKLKVQIDYKNKNILFTKSKKKSRNKGLINGIGQPFITAKTSNGKNLFLHFDTGSDRLTLFDNIKSKIENKLDKEKTTVSFGINKTVKEKEGIIKEFSLNIGGYTFNLKKVGVRKIEISSGSLVQLNGRIGNNVFANGKISFDYQNGAFEYSE